MATGEQRRQEERRRRRAQQQDLLLAESLGKHPLQNRWALWFFKNDKSKMWQANLRLVTKFSTVEDFWALYNHIQLASKLTSGCDYSLFKDGIEPMWEDSQNKRGGRWLITLAKQQRHTELDRFWLETLELFSPAPFPSIPMQDEAQDVPCHAMLSRAMLSHAVLSYAMPCHAVPRSGTCASHSTRVPHILSSAISSSSAPSWPQHPAQPSPCLAPGARPHPAGGAGHYALFIRQHLPRL
ncbi:eukaryotic translation initiation factor 4E type 1B isoform X2 [Athene cunicularia]|uniref:eukaryotic translation initiation factor 4E type 1B isoform X2 n=1 Tax=Athene cunicularia TaxID=194338 RepID=UPI000EF6A8F2|nr:eukaryotic translation initiation factor 4E type 1B isoform X2 [Athene cunicularia]